MKAVIGWATADLTAAARNITSGPAECWQWPEHRGEYEFYRQVIRRSGGFMRATGYFTEPFSASW